MQVLTLVLNRTECLEELLEALLKSGIHGGTVLEAGDVVVLLCDQQELPQVHAALEHQCKGN